MKIKNKKTKLWIARLMVFILIPIIIFLILYFTNNLNVLYDNIQKEVSKLSIVSITIITFLFIIDILKGWVSNYISDMLFPGEIKQIKKDTEEIKKEQISQGETLKNILENVDFDPRIIQEYLGQLTAISGLENKTKEIEKWYNDGKITEKIEKVLKMTVKYNQETIVAFEKKIKKLKQTSKDSEYVLALENLKNYLQNNKPEQVTKNYFDYIQKQKQQNIELLKKSIDATKQLFAYEETKQLFKELIKLEPTAENYFNYAYFLQKFNYINEAIEQYEEALQIYRKLAEENPRTYLPYVATTLNNLANLHSDKNEFPQALEKYEEALRIYRKFAEENPRTYEMDYARMLLMGVDLFKKEKKNLEEAKKILLKYKGIPYADKFLNIIDEIDSNK